MGRPIAMTHLDPQGDNARYQEFARRFLDKDQVDVLIGGETSAPPDRGQARRALLLHQPV
jgi:branched-chain amino acid transport system substrate-binding protein